jgi:hypothetical protein
MPWRTALQDGGATVEFQGLQKKFTRIYRDQATDTYVSLKQMKIEILE